jgi:thiosulfate dehydrogenase [quinone] large subunit
MPLRLFLGVTFTYAGLQKLANPAFFRSSSPVSIHAQLVGAQHSSPIHAVLGPLVHVAPAVGAVIAIGEVAIGLGTLVGLWMRLAAAAGMLLSFGLFLTVSFHSSPYFTGADIVFLFAWTPVLLAGAAGAPALDTWFADRAVADRASAAGTRSGGGVGVSRRDVVSKGAVTGLLAGVVVVLGGAVAGIGRAVGSGTTTASGPTLGGGTTGGSATTTTAPASTSTTAGSSATSTAVPSGTKLGSSSTVPVGGSATFTDPASGDPGLVIQQTAGEFVAFDAVCPHAGCTVAYAKSAKIIACPCHGSEFDASTGAVIQGPASRGLTRITVAESGGDLYVDG